MNAPENLPSSQSLSDDESPVQARKLFPLENLQRLDKESALCCQTILGHGKTFGVWETTESFVPHMRKHIRRIDLRRRIFSFLPKEIQTTHDLDVLLDEGILWLTRLALLMRMGPAGLASTAKFKPLDASTIARVLYVDLPKLIARGVICQLDRPYRSSMVFVSILTTNDLSDWWTLNSMCTELKRLTQLRGLGLWSDAPPEREFKGKSTPVRGMTIQNPSERRSIPHPPIPDDYLSVMGPRVLWLIKDVGPCLVHLLESLITMLESELVKKQESKNIKRYAINRFIQRYFVTNIWRDLNGRAIEKPPFDLQIGSNRGKSFRNDPSKHDLFEWPPRHWEGIQALTATLQSSHLWITLLVMAARIGEVATLGRDCVDFANDGKAYANGKTYKPSRALEGKDRDWPIPDILLDVLAQQVRLVEICERIENNINHSPDVADFVGVGNHLWASLGASSNTDATQQLVHHGKCLEKLATRIGLTPTPGGKNLHPHRFRTTLARLAGLAIDGSQKVLMLLLGHDDVITTLGYMQSDRAFAKEVADITRELRIMRGEALIEDMRTALRTPNSLPYGGHGGGGAPVLADSVRAYEEELHRTGEEWGVNTARELSVLLTNNGESARLISAHVVCTKTAGEVGLCSSKKGAIVAGNCQAECGNHIEDKTGRRDTERVIPILVQHAQKNIASNDWLPLARDKKQLEQELKRYDDIGAHWRAKPDVQAILGADT